MTTQDAIKVLSSELGGCATIAEDFKTCADASDDIKKSIFGAHSVSCSGVPDPSPPAAPGKTCDQNVCGCHCQSHSSEWYECYSALDVESFVKSEVGSCDAITNAADCHTAGVRIGSIFKDFETAGRTLTSDVTVRCTDIVTSRPGAETGIAIGAVLLGCCVLFSIRKRCLTAPGAVLRTRAAGL